MIDPGPVTFDAEIYRPDVTGASSFVNVPLDVPTLFGTKARVPVNAIFDGASYRGSLVTFGGPGHRILVVAEVQQRIGKSAGDTVHVQLRLDTAERVVDLDPDVEGALRASGRLERFRALAYSHQKEYWLWISGAKKPETRAARIEKMLGMLDSGERLK